MIYPKTWRILTSRSQLLHSLGTPFVARLKFFRRFFRHIFTIT